MKAIVCRAFGPPETLTLEDMPDPQPGAGEVVIDVHAAGVNFPDLLMVQGKYQRKPPFPFIPGMEVAGVVRACGQGVVAFAPGDRVCAHVAQTGAFATQALVPVNHALAPIPGNVSFEAAAALPLAYGTSYEALSDRAGLRAGETLLVLGASGGVGLAAVQLGKIMGARVIACASSDEKLALCRAHGADELINYESEDLRASIRRITGDKGVDVVLDPVGGRFAEPALRGIARYGRYCVVGFATGAIPSIALNLVLLKVCSIVGVAIGANVQRDPEGYHRRLVQMLDWMDQGLLNPVVSARYPLERAGEALAAFATRAVQGKIVITMGHP